MNNVDIKIHLRELDHEQIDSETNRLYEQTYC